MCLGLLQHLEATGQRLTHLRMVCVGGSACPPSMIQARALPRLGLAWGVVHLCAPACVPHVVLRACRTCSGNTRTRLITEQYSSYMHSA